MYPTILHIYGPFALHSFSVAIAMGVALFIYKALKHPGLEAILGKSQFINFVLEGTLISLVGGRILFILEEWHSFASYFEMLAIWNRGLSSLGCVATALIYISWYIKKNNIQAWALCDILGLYAPIIHVCTRIGCLLAGCCYGQPTQLAWGITYTHTGVVAPLGIKLHPTQIYSALIFLGIYLLLRTISRKQVSNPNGGKREIIGSGIIGLTYLFLSSLERLSVDFLRGDRIINSRTAVFNSQLLSFDQWIAVGLSAASIIGFAYLYRTQQSVKQSIS